MEVAVGIGRDPSCALGESKAMERIGLACLVEIEADEVSVLVFEVMGGDPMLGGHGMPVKRG
jgi:hypothetical protein